MRSALRTSLLALALGGCGSGSETPPPGGKTDLIRAEAGCEVEGLPSPLRQTVVFLDARALQPSTNAREFVSRNGPVRDLVLSLAEPGRILTSGVTASRERVSIAVVPADGSPAQQVFTGCPPGLSASELADAGRQSSAATEFFTGDVASKFAKQVEGFDDQLIGALSAAGQRAAGGTPSGGVAASRFLAGVAASGALFDSRDRALRLILVSDLSPLDPAGGFEQGLAAGNAAGGQFGLAEVHLVAPPGRAVAHQPFLRGWFLAQGAQLASAGSGRVATVTAPPKRLWRLEGNAGYSAGPEPVSIRLGEDGAGKLTASWLALRGTVDRATPMTGTISCTETDRCTIQSDEGGFAQAWSGKASSQPAFNSEWPFGGMRSFAFTLAGQQLTGRVFDEGVYIAGPDAGPNAGQNAGPGRRNGIAVTATRKR